MEILLPTAVKTCFNLCTSGIQVNTVLYLLHALYMKLIIISICRKFTVLMKCLTFVCLCIRKIYTVTNCIIFNQNEYFVCMPLLTGFFKVTAVFVDTFQCHLCFVCRLCEISVWRKFCAAVCSCCGSYR